MGCETPQFVGEYRSFSRIARGLAEITRAVIDRDPLALNAIPERFPEFDSNDVEDIALRIYATMAEADALSVINWLRALDECSVQASSDQLKEKYENTDEIVALVRMYMH